MRYLALSLIILFGCAHQPRAGSESGATEVTMKKNEPSRVRRFELADSAAVGGTAGGQTISLGGFSGLRFLGKSETGKLRFLTLTDRGPNADEQKEADKVFRPFLIPGFQPAILYLVADPATGSFTVEKRIPLTRPDGKPLSGLPPRAGGEIPLDAFGKQLPYDPYGMDPEGIVLTPEGEYWISEEYGPSLALFSAQGRLLEVLKPGQGLPKVFEQIQLNRGFEGLAMNGGQVFVMAQSPLDNPRSPKQKNSKKSRIVRMLEVDPAERRTAAQFGYWLGEGKDLKIGDLAPLREDQFLLIEQNGKTGSKAVKRLVRIELTRATDLQGVSERVAGANGSFERMTEAELKAAGLALVEKEEVLDLTDAGVHESKVEGIDLVDPETVALIVDNDFGLSGEWDRKTGKVEFKDEKPALYLVRWAE